MKISARETESQPIPVSATLFRRGYHCLHRPVRTPRVCLRENFPTKLRVSPHLTSHPALIFSHPHSYRLLLEVIRMCFTLKLMMSLQSGCDLRDGPQYRGSASNCAATKGLPLPATAGYFEIVFTHMRHGHHCGECAVLSLSEKPLSFVCNGCTAEWSCCAL